MVENQLRPAKRCPRPYTHHPALRDSDDFSVAFVPLLFINYHRYTEIDTDMGKVVWA